MVKKRNKNKDLGFITAIVLAAGKGTRMKSDLPKVLHEVCGVPLVFYNLWAVSGIKRVKQSCVVAGYKKNLVEKKIKEEFKNIKFAHQKKLNGSAKAVESALNTIKGKHVLVLCGDCPVLDRKVLSRAIRSHLNKKNDCTVLTKNIESPAGLGRIIRDEKGRFLQIKERTELNSKEKKIKEVNTGMYIFKRRALVKEIKKIKQNSKKKEYYLTDIIEVLKKGKYKVDGFQMRDGDEFLSVNNLRDLTAAEKSTKAYLLERFMDKGVKIIDPKTTFVGPKTSVGKGTVIYPFTFLENNVKIGSSCLIGPFAHVRKGTVINAHSEIGNFSELVRSRLGEKVKMKHFSYLGDAEIKENVNIGAGSVVANFDGKNKHKTIVGKNSFIGSDTVLVAPLKVGENSRTGAGSVVVRNVKDGTLVVGVPAKQIKKKKR